MIVEARVARKFIGYKVAAVNQIGRALQNVWGSLYNISWVTGILNVTCPNDTPFELVEMKLKLCSSVMAETITNGLLPDKFKGEFPCLVAR